jgi:hypothetical protein
MFMEDKCIQFAFNMFDRMIRAGNSINSMELCTERNPCDKAMVCNEKQSYSNENV